MLSVLLMTVITPNFNLSSGIVGHYGVIFPKVIILSVDMQNCIAPSVILSSVMALSEH